jgi:hypothetical protein
MKKRTCPTQPRIVVVTFDTPACVLDGTMRAAIHKALNEPLPDESAPPLCMDCVHFESHNGFRASTDCVAIVKFNPVYGNAPYITPCGIQRSPGKPCGPEGRLFKPRPPSRWRRFKAFFDCPGPL